ncbi:MAG TPA: hypothetical protein VK061_08590 [Bacillota bacterium]|nr:hypothetical protein [Bacillota bacterium]
MLNHSEGNPDAFLDFFDPQQIEASEYTTMVEFLDEVHSYYKEEWPQGLERKVEWMSFESLLQIFGLSRYIWDEKR